MRIFFGIVVLLFVSACESDTSQTESCVQYIQCMEARDALSGITTNVDRYLPEGSCWGGIEAGRDLCDRSCVAGLKFLQDRDPDAPEACQP
jgi:hypothetical protein